MLSGVAFVTVELINVNDNEPMFNQTSYNFTFDEEIPVDFVIGTVTVSFSKMKKLFLINIISMYHSSEQCLTRALIGYSNSGE